MTKRGARACVRRGTRRRGREAKSGGVRPERERARSTTAVGRAWPPFTRPAGAAPAARAVRGRASQAPGSHRRRGVRAAAGPPPRAAPPLRPARARSVMSRRDDGGGLGLGLSSACEQERQPACRASRALVAFRICSRVAPYTTPAVTAATRATCGAEALRSSRTRRRGERKAAARRLRRAAHQRECGLARVHGGRDRCVCAAQRRPQAAGRGTTAALFLVANSK